MSIARIYTQRFAARKGKTIACEKCGTPIAKGEQYRSFQVGFRSKYTHVRCMKVTCTPKPSELESSMLSEVYAAQESAEATLDSLDGADPEENADSIEAAVREYGEALRTVSEQYAEAVEAMGAAGEGSDNDERRETLEGSADALEYWDVPDDETDFDGCENEAHEKDPGDKDYLERGDDDCDSCRELKQDWWNGAIEAAREAINDAELP